MLCGIGRLSPRSLLATAIFFPTAVATFHITNPALKTADCPSGTRCYRPTYPGFGAMVPLVVLLVPIGAGLAFVRAQGVGLPAIFAIDRFAKTQRRRQLRSEAPMGLRASSLALGFLCLAWRILPKSKAFSH